MIVPFFFEFDFNLFYFADMLRDYLEKNQIKTLDRKFRLTYFLFFA